MKKVYRVLGALVGIVLATPIAAADSVKIGFITTLSGPAGYLGEDARDGFQLAIDLEGGRLGNIPVELLVEDDQLKPATGKQLADKFVKSDKVKIVSGIIFSNVAIAAVPGILESGAFFISPNAAPSEFAGQGCHKNYFVVSWQNDNLHESAGKAASDLGYKKMAILAPNYQAGKDALAGFRRYYKGEIVAEIFTKLDQTDFAPEIAQIRAAKPDAVFHFHPGGLGIAFTKQYIQAGLIKDIPLVAPMPSMENRVMTAIGDAAIGIQSTSHWNQDFTNEANKKFMAEFQKKYKRVPTEYAQQGYDAALLIASALKAVGGDINQEDKFRMHCGKLTFSRHGDPSSLHLISTQFRIGMLGL
ncbi:MAG: ABC transporter substrate-binding protein [Alphaproteobacteria bacterium]